MLFYLPMACYVVYARDHLHTQDLVEARHVVMAYLVMARIVVARIAMAHIAVALYSYGLRGITSTPRTSWRRARPRPNSVYLVMAHIAHGL